MAENVLMLKMCYSLFISFSRHYVPDTLLNARDTIESSSWDLQFIEVGNINHCQS